MSAPARSALHVTLDSGDPEIIDASQITRIEKSQGRTWVECGRMVYVVREEPLALKLQIRGGGRAARGPVTTTQRVFSA